jgi:hypothetical protein
MVIRYHKGIKNTLIYLGNDEYEINDIVIRQDGQVFCDWDFTANNLLPTRLLHTITKEEQERIDRMSSRHYAEYGRGGRIIRGTSGCGGCSVTEYSCGGLGGCGGAYSSFRGYSCGGGSSCG